MSLPRPYNLPAHYGFTVNPYDPSPLGVSEDDAELFVGRETEGAAFLTFLSSFDRGAIFVEGGTGVGKTSFVNVQQYRLVLDEPILPSLNVIELRDGMTVTEFLLSVLSNGLNSLRHMQPDVVKETEFQRLAQAVEQTLIVTRSYQASLVSFGAGYGSNVAATNPNLTLLPTVSRHLDEFAQLAATFGYVKTIVSVNNLDTIDPRFFVSFMQHARDLTLIRHRYLWVFTGPQGSRALLAKDAHRVSELVTSDPIVLPPLSKREVHEAIEARIRKFRVSEDVQAPVAREVIDILYDASRGEFRYILNRAKDLLVRTMSDFPTTRTVTLEIATPILRELAFGVIARAALTTKQRNVLKALAEKGQAQPKEYEHFGFNGAATFVPYLKQFHECGLVDRKEVGREVIYTPRGDVALAFHGGTALPEPLEDE